MTTPVVVSLLNHTRTRRNPLRCLSAGFIVISPSGNERIRGEERAREYHHIFIIMAVAAVRSLYERTNTRQSAVRVADWFHTRARHDYDVHCARRSTYCITC